MTGHAAQGSCEHKGLAGQGPRLILISLDPQSCFNPRFPELIYHLFYRILSEEHHHRLGGLRAYFFDGHQAFLGSIPNLIQALKMPAYELCRPHPDMPYAKGIEELVERPGLGHLYAPDQVPSGLRPHPGQLGYVFLSEAVYIARVLDQS